MDETKKQQILDGDLEAYAEFVGKYQNMVKGYALRRLGNWEIAEDVVHLTFVRAFQKLEEFDTNEEFGVWLCVTCKYLILSELEKRRREIRNHDNYRKILEFEVASAAAKDLEIDYERDRADALKACFEELKDESAELVKQRYFSKLSCKEIAEKQERTVTWVTSTLSRARKALRGCLENELRPGTG